MSNPNRSSSVSTKETPSNGSLGSNRIRVSPSGYVFSNPGRHSAGPASSPIVPQANTAYGPNCRKGTKPFSRNLFQSSTDQISSEVTITSLAFRPMFFVNSAAFPIGISRISNATAKALE